MSDEFPGLEVIARQAMERAEVSLPPDVRLTIIAVHINTDRGGIAYVSQCERRGMVEALIEWLAKLARDPEYRQHVADAFGRHFLGRE